MKEEFTNRNYKKLVASKIVRVFTFCLIMVASVYITIIVFRIGYLIGFRNGQVDTVNYYNKLVSELPTEVVVIDDADEPTPTFIPKSIEDKSLIRTVSWGGPELWSAVNKRRTELGVNPLQQRDELCTIASIRLNELLELGKLDGHEGFGNLEERRPDLAWIFDKYNLSEFLLSGASNPAEAVSLWENTLGHKQIVSGGEYVWGCIYASYGFAVAIAAF